MVAHQLHDQRRYIFCQRMLIGGVIGDMHLGNASDFCCLFAYAAAALARDQQMHFAQLRGCSHDRQRCVLYRRIVMFNPNQRLHHATPRALSLPTSSSTSATLMRSEEHTSELQSLMRISYAVFC